MTFLLRRVSMIAALLSASAVCAAPAVAEQGAAKEVVEAKPGQSVEASARQRARELNHDSVLRGVGQADQSQSEFSRGQASAGDKPHTLPGTAKKSQ